MRRLLATAALALLAAAPAHAAIITDQQNASFNSSLGSFGTEFSIGQSFTPTLNAISFITASVAVGQDETSSYRVDLFAGEGFSGQRLGSSAAATLTINTTDALFNFASAIALAPQSLYTFRLVRESGANLNLFSRIDSRNPYTRGQLFLSGGSPFSGYDLVFSEGYDTSVPIGAVAAPEPGVMVLAASGLPVALGFWLRRRRKVKVA